MNTTLKKKRAYEYKLTPVRDVAASRKIDTPESALDYWREVIEKRSWFQLNREHLVVLLLNTRFHLEGHSLISVGSLNETIAHPREILAPVICGGAYGFILLHNHPSGDLSPSETDRTLTKRLKKGAELLQVNFADHVIVGREETFSFREMGLA